MTDTTTSGQGVTSAARERILDAAYDLFSRRGIRDVGVDEVIDRAGVAKATLYRHFSSKDDLVIAFLEMREQRWVMDWVVAESQRRDAAAEGQLLAIFDLFDEWFHRDTFEACSLINVLLEMGPESPAGASSLPASRDHSNDPRKPRHPSRSPRPRNVRTDHGTSS